MDDFAKDARIEQPKVVDGRDAARKPLDQVKQGFELRLREHIVDADFGVWAPDPVDSAIKDTAQIAVEISFKDGVPVPTLLRPLGRVFGYCNAVRHVFLLRRGETVDAFQFPVTKSIRPSPFRSPTAMAEGVAPTPNSTGDPKVPSPAFR